MNMKEGFICPHCIASFNTINNLKDHFLHCQIDQSVILREDTGILGILKKAKRTLEDVFDAKNIDFILTETKVNHLEENKEPYMSFAFYEEPNVKIQHDGVTIDRTEEFINCRRLKTQSRAIETSNLLIRIEKLISFSQNSSSTDRKNFEQSLVEWIQDDLVPMCPSCGVKFGLNLAFIPNTDHPIILSSKDGKVPKQSSRLKSTITNLLNFEMDRSGPFIKKKHHCRLCGGLICSNCSFMFSYTEASRLVSSFDSLVEVKESQWKGSGSLIWKEDSETSLDSINPKIKQKENCIRCCGHCKAILVSKWSQMKQRVLESDMVIIYKELIEEMNKTSELIDEFQKMYQSLSSGETDYSYHEANQMRSEIVNRCQQIDVLGNRFKSKTSMNGNAKEVNLFNSIYKNAYFFLQNNFATLKYLPSEEEFTELATMKLMKIRDEVNENKNKGSSNDQIRYIQKNQFEDFGWAPSLKANGMSALSDNNFNPFEIENTEIVNVAIQIENVRRFIDEARDAKRLKDVEILQRNMIDLENEYETLQKKLYA